nr:DUF4087 domain-containing protein [Methylobacterium radiotolerans]
MSALSLCLGIWSTGLSASEKRCGWLQNPTPGNWWLIDKDAKWILREQGEFDPSGFDIIPDISKRYFVKSNGNYGYTCACIGGEFDATEHRITEILSFEQRSVRICRKDHALKRP